VQGILEADFIFIFIVDDWKFSSANEELTM
jgi:hypothetical protein